MTANDLSPDDGPEPGTERVVARLHADRPVPHPGFRGTLRRRLVAASPRRSAPSRIRVAIVGYAASGLGLLGVAILGLAGAGPFAA